MRASAVSLRRQNMEGLLAMFMLGAVLWLISVAGVCVLFGKEFLTSPLIGYYILNTALMLGIALSLSYLVGIFVKTAICSAEFPTCCHWECAFCAEPLFQ